MTKILVFLLTIPSLALASGLQASFSGAQDPCGGDPSLVFCYDGEVDTSGNLVDKAGENVAPYRTEINQWTEQGTCPVTADQWRSPVTGLMTADYIDNTGGVNTDRRWELVDTGAVIGDVYTLSVWLRADYNHNVSLGLEQAFTNQTVAVTTTWKRFSYTKVISAAGSVYADITPGEYGVSTGTVYASDVHVVKNDQYRTNLGEYLNPADQSIVKPAHDLAPTNAPTRALSDAESQGNRLAARRFDSAADQHYSKAHHDSMNVNDSDHTYTFYVMKSSSGIAEDVLFDHSAGYGMYLTNQTQAGPYAILYFNGVGGLLMVTSAAGPFNDNKFRVIQAVRDSNIATIYVDGIAGTPIDITGYGVDGSSGMYLGTWQGGTNYDWDGDIAFAKLEARALSEDQLAAEREKIWGVYGGKGSSLASWTIARSTVAHKTFKAGGAHAINSKMTEVAAGVPRATLDGLLVEGQATNEANYSETFNNWNSVRCSVGSNTTIAPDGSTTVDTFHEDNTAADLHFIYILNGVSVTTGEDWTFSIYVAPINRDWIMIQLEDGGTNMQGWFNVAEGRVGSNSADVDRIGMEPAAWPFYRVWISGEINGTVDIDTYLYIAEDDNDITFDGLDQDSLYLWGAQVEEGTFPTSYIETPSTANVTRTADDITMLPCEDSHHCVLPLGFGGAGQPDKLTISFDAKCQYSDSTDIGKVRYWVSINGSTGTASVTRNNFRFYPYTNGKLYFEFRDDADADHYGNLGAGVIDWAEWHSYRFFVDFADMSRMDAWVDGDSSGIVGWAGRSGTAEFDLTNTKIRIGQDYAGVVGGNCEVKNLSIRPKEIRP